MNTYQIWFGCSIVGLCLFPLLCSLSRDILGKHSGSAMMSYALIMMSSLFTSSYVLFGGTAISNFICVSIMVFLVMILFFFG